MKQLTISHASDPRTQYDVLALPNGKFNLGVRDGQIFKPIFPDMTSNEIFDYLQEEQAWFFRGRSCRIPAASAGIT